jgi:hypothetical protein
MRRTGDALAQGQARGVTLDIPRAHRVGRATQERVGARRGHPLVLLAAQTQHLQRSRAPFVHTAREVIELLDLPAVRLGDAAPGPQQNLLIAPELGHRLAHPYELVR